MVFRSYGVGAISTSLRLMIFVLNRVPTREGSAVLQRAHRDNVQKSSFDVFLAFEVYMVSLQIWKQLFLFLVPIGRYNFWCSAHLLLFDIFLFVASQLYQIIFGEIVSFNVIKFGAVSQTAQIVV